MLRARLLRHQKNSAQKGEEEAVHDSWHSCGFYHDKGPPLFGLAAPGPRLSGGGGYTLAPAYINSLCIPGNVINVFAVSSVPMPPPPAFSPPGGNEPPGRCSLGHPSYHDGSRRPTSRGVAAAAGEEGETGAAAARGEKSGSQRRRHGGGSVPAAAPSAREGGGATHTPNTHNTKPGCEIIKTWRGNGTVTWGNRPAAATEKPTTAASIVSRARQSRQLPTPPRIAWRSKSATSFSRRE